MKLATKIEQQQIITVDLETSVEHEDANPAGAWLPITESIKGNAFTFASHLLCSGIEIRTLALPIAFMLLEWQVVRDCLFVHSILLAALHQVAYRQSSRITVRISSHQISPPLNGEKLWKLLAVFSTIYVSEWFPVFISLAILVAQFYPNLDSLAHISLTGSISAVVYCSLIWILFIITKGKHDLEGPWEAKISGLDGICNVLNGLGIIALAFRGHNVVLEIQVTHHLNPL
ncbi:unnamed protein product [Fraxinus pennsylvanica]|uniref:Amino acid transporter transmembrane domain-containing protein n=1 Tax=Fraxinus pennsylvanica TaxID=56036 RepID=A0AAD1Z7Q7_9LAMI|nr:unnamed protein product [Fraxinus pennsylvanica]